MAGLKNICKMYGKMTVQSGKKKIKYVYDYANDVAVEEKEMPIGSERHAASEQAKYALM